MDHHLFINEPLITPYPINSLNIPIFWIPAPPAFVNRRVQNMLNTLATSCKKSEKFQALIFNEICNKFHRGSILEPFLSKLQNKINLKVMSVTFLQICLVSLKGSTCETRKNFFYFSSKALFVLEVIKFQLFRCSNVMASSNA